MVDHRLKTTGTLGGIVGKLAMGMRVATLVFAMILLGGVSIASAAIEPEFTEFSMTPSTTQAGGHPDLRVTTSWTIEESTCPDTCVTLSHFETHAPAGLIPNPHVAPVCTVAEFVSAACPVDSQIGIVADTLGPGLFIPLYNMETKPDQAGLAAFTTPLLETPAFIEFFSRTNNDYGLDSVSSPIIRGVGINKVTVYFWGVPADPVHDYQRFISPLSFLGACENITTGCPGTTFAEPTTPKAPFLSNPTTCGVPLTASADGHYYNGTEVHVETAYPPTSGCSQLSFSPSITAKPTTPQTDSPSGVDLDLQVPQNLSPDTPSPSELRTTRVKLPDGFSLNAGAADGKVACLDSQTSIGTLLAAACPEFAKIGTLELDVSALPGPIPGALYIGEPKTGNRYRVVLTADGFATHVKLIGAAYPDPQTGRVTIEFKDLPQSPLQEFNLHIFGSKRGLFATPKACGTYPVEAEFVPWDASLTTRKTVSFMTFGTGPGGTPCPAGARRFSPSLHTGVLNSTAGQHSPFSTAVIREDGDQDLAGIEVRTPMGLAATLRGIDYCPEATIAGLGSPAYSGLLELTSPACPVSSRVGSVTAGAGAGTHPVYLQGTAYLGGPYKGAPLSLVTVVPAVSGPYDLGNVAIRIALYVNPVTARVTAVSDPLPQIVEGVPLRTRFVLVDLDRPGFTLNPTNCDPLAVEASLAGLEGAVSSPQAHFQVSDCAELNYRPQVTLQLVRGLKRRGHPSIKAVFRADAGEANSRRVAVTLPKGELLDNSHIQTVCTRVQFADSRCPAGSRIGRVEVFTPILDAPLRGSVFLRSSARKLPDMVLDLKGQVDVEASAKIDSVRGRLRATFEQVPDVPVSRIVLRLAGGKKGLLQNSRSVCGGPRMPVLVRLKGHNGARTASKERLRANCRPSKKHRRHNKAQRAVR